MRLHQLIFLTCILFFQVVGGDELLTNKDVVRMVEGGLPDSIIIQKITSSKCAFGTSVEELLALKRAGVSGEVIGAILSKAKEATQIDEVSSSGHGREIAQSARLQVLVETRSGLAGLCELHKGVQDWEQPSLEESLASLNRKNTLIAWFMWNESGAIRDFSDGAGNHLSPGEIEIREGDYQATLLCKEFYAKFAVGWTTYRERVGDIRHYPFLLQLAVKPARTYKLLVKVPKWANKATGELTEIPSSFSETSPETRPSLKQRLESAEGHKTSYALGRPAEFPVNYKPGKWLVHAGKLIVDRQNIWFDCRDCEVIGNAESFSFSWKNISRICVDDGPVHTYLEFSLFDGRTERFEPLGGAKGEAQAIELLKVLSDAGPSKLAYAPGGIARARSADSSELQIGLCH